MAEAFGIFTGVASLADIAVRVGTDLSQMSRDMKNAPEDIQALSNEVNDIRAVLKVLEELRLDNAADSRILSTEGILKQLERELAQAKTVLDDLDMLVKGCQSRKTFETRFKWWRKNKNQADCLRRQLREVRNRILELLSAFNGCSVQELLPATRKVELELCSVRIATQDGLNNITNGMEDGQRRMDGIVRQMARETQDHVSAGFQDLEASISSKMATQHDEYLDRISEIHDTNEQVNQALSRVEAAVNQQLDNSDAMVKQLQDIFAWMQEHGPPPQSPAQNSRPPDTTNTNLRSDPENSNSGQGPECLPHKPPLELNSILYLTLGRRSSQCVRGCPCACHIRPHQRSWKLPGLVRNVLGSLFVGYAASPTTPVKCSVKTCVRDRRTRLTVTYAFPLWFLGYVVRGVVERTAAGTISLGLVPCRRVPATMRASNILWAASSGSLEDVRVILRSSPAVVTDISASEGSSVLIHALTGCCSWESRLSIVQTLLVQGADPDMPNDSGVSPRLYIAYISMLRLVPEEIRPGMERLFPLQETVESLELTYLHEVVLGRCNAALEEVLKTRDRAILSQVNEKDAMGVTPLMYAAKLGNEGHVRALLDAGADVNTENNYGETALCLASANVLHLLIGAGADVNSATKYHKVTPLHHAAAADDPVVLEQLLSAGANIEQQTADGSTAVHYAAQCNSTRALTVLHKHNANINARDLWGKTPLMVAICYNAHNALDTLLSLNADYLSLTKRKWNILCYAAYYGDVETLNILAKCKLDISPWRRIENKIEYAVKVFHIRRRISQEVSEAFGKFLASLRKHSQEDDRGDPDYSIILAENNEMVESETAKANGNGNDKVRRNKKGDDSEEDEDGGEEEEEDEEEEEEEEEEEGETEENEDSSVDNRR